MIEIQNLCREFQRGKVKAVKDVSFTIRDNEIFALLGPNGAGKTTTMRMLSTLLAPTSGRIQYEGLSSDAEIKKNIGFLTNEIRLDGQFTPNQLAQFYGSLYGLAQEELTRNREKLFSYFGITPFADRKYETFSTGMKQKTSMLTRTPFPIAIPPL